MTLKRKIQMITDLAMTTLLPLLMAYSLIGERFHEYAGTAMFIFFLLHHMLNRQWHKNLFRGRYTPVRMLGTVINAAMLFCMLAMMFSGIVMSRYTFAFLSISRGASFARKAHLIASYWCYVLAAFHLGLHGNMILGMLRKAARAQTPSAVRTRAAESVAVLLCGYGLYAFQKRGFLRYMLLRNEFVFFDFSEPLILFLMDYLAIMALFAVLGYYTAKTLTRPKKQK